jgi:hypothetical protein
MSTTQKLFTVEEANAMLPLVRAIATDLANLSREVIERRERLTALLANRKPQAANDPYSEELTHIEEELSKDAAHLHEYVDELRALGVEPKNGPEGLVDFPSMMDGRVVYLCWKLGESEVLHWHELDAGYQGRQSLFVESATGDAASGADNADGE